MAQCVPAIDFVFSLKSGAVTPKGAYRDGLRGDFRVEEILGHPSTRA